MPPPQVCSQPEATKDNRMNTPRPPEWARSLVIQIIGDFVGITHPDLEYGIGTIDAAAQMIVDAVKKQATDDPMVASWVNGYNKQATSHSDMMKDIRAKAIAKNQPEIEYLKRLGAVSWRQHHQDDHPKNV